MPEQWLISKIIPVRKKGDKTMIENYRPIANLCCVSNLFEKTLCKRATPETMLKYKLALCLFKLYNKDFNLIEFEILNFNQILIGRQTNFIKSKSNSLKVGINSLANRLFVINNGIPLNWLNMSIDTFKVHCKKSIP